MLEEFLYGHVKLMHGHGFNKLSFKISLLISCSILLTTLSTKYFPEIAVFFAPVSIILLFLAFKFFGELVVGMFTLCQCGKTVDSVDKFFKNLSLVGLAVPFMIPSLVPFTNIDSQNNFLILGLSMLVSSIFYLLLACLPQKND